MRKLCVVLALVLLGAACTKETPQIQEQMPEESEVQTMMSGESGLCYDATAVDLAGSCPTALDPVCACGIITFPNQCFAERAGFVNTTPGECNLVASACVVPTLPAVLARLGADQCPAVYQPVCGCDGETYSNSCVALNNGVVAFVPGECNSDGGILGSLGIGS